MESVQRAMSVLDALADGGAELGTNEIARRTGINMSTVSRLLATLVAGGMVQYVRPTGRYRLGVRILQLASATRRNLDLRALARPYLDELSELTGETSTLSLPGEHEVLTIDFAQRDVSVRSVAAIGRNSVAHATAVGKVFLAWGGRLPDEELTSFTSHTITDRVKLDTEIERVRSRGWAQAVQEREDELNGIAAPVLEPTGQLVAIVGVQGPSSRFTQKAMRAAVRPMTDRAALIASVV